MYAVLVEGGDLDEPIADEVRGVLDGHIVLSRAIAERGLFPAVDVPASISRVMPKLVPEAHRHAARRLTAALAALEEKRDLIALGAYEKGSDPMVDRALACRSEIEAFLGQASETCVSSQQAVERMTQLVRNANL